MGKKFKAGAVLKDTGIGQKTESKDGSAGLMGLSLKSKKIKKPKKSETVPAPKVLDALPNATVAKNGDGSVGKKRKKHKKHKKHPQGAVSAEGKPQVKVEQTGSETPKKSKKHKKKKDKANANGVKVEEAQQAIGEKEVKTDETSEVKKSKKHKKKNKPHGNEESRPTTAGEVEVKVEGNEDVVQKKSKKHKRKASEVEPETAVEESPKKKHKKRNKHGKDSARGVKVEESEAAGEPKRKQAKPKPTAKALEADRDVDTSESESDDEEDAAHKEMDRANQKILKQHSSKAENEDDSSEDEKQTDKKAKGQEAKEEKTAKRFTGPEHSIFIGNLPNTVKKSTIKSLFNQYGKILTLRFRSSDGVTLFKRKDRKKAKALNCYIRFETKPEAQAACAMNGQLVEGNRIRVTVHTQKQMGHASSTVFVGNINHKTTDNELYDFFSRVGEIEYVRQIADRGIGYVCFKKGVSIAKALKLNQQLLNGRALRIMKVDPAKQHQRRNKKGNLVAKNRAGGAGGKPPAADAKNRQQGGPNPKAPTKDFHGSVAHNKMGKKHKTAKGGGDKKKKLLAQKLSAAGNFSRNK